MESGSVLQNFDLCVLLVQHMAREKYKTVCRVSTKV